MSCNILVCLFFSQLVVHHCEAGCAALNAPTFGRVFHDRHRVNGEFPVSTVAFISCDSGYIHDGAKVAVCLESGYWHSAGEPTVCTDPSEICPRLHLPQGNVTYGRLFPENQEDRRGIEATFACPSGYILHGPTGAYCSNENRWRNNNDNSQNAACAATCRPFSLRDGNVRYTRNAERNGGYLYGTVAFFTCSHGYSLSGSSSATCNYEGKWNPEEISCNSVFEYIYLERRDCLQFQDLHSIKHHWTEDRANCKKWCNARQDCGGFVVYRNLCIFKRIACGNSLIGNGQATAYIKQVPYTKINNKDCLYGDNLAVIWDRYILSDLDYCKTRCNTDDNCGGFTFFGSSCTLKKKTCYDNRVNKQDCYIYLKEEI